MLALLVAVTIVATPTPQPSEASSKPRTPLGPSRTPLEPRSAPASDADADASRTRSSSEAEAEDDTSWAREEAPRAARKRPNPDEVWKDDLRKRAPPATPEAELPLSAQRAKRFIGALLGGAVGLAAPMFFMPLADRACVVSLPGGFPAFVCPTPAHVLIGSSALVTAITGAAVGVAVAGGEVSGGALVTGTFVGLFLALALSAVTVAVSPGGLPEGAGTAVLGFGSGLVVASQAVAMLLRDDAIEERPWLASSAGRIAASSLAFAGSLGVGLLAAVLLASAFSVVGATLAAGLAIVSPLLAPLAAWGAHRGLNGRGNLGVSYLATLGVAALGLLGGAMFAVSNSFAPGDDGARLRGGAITALLVGGALLGSLGVPLALEASHASVLVEERGRKVNVSLGGAPVPGGAMGVVTARF